jgi:hypothetical protein
MTRNPKCVGASKVAGPMATLNGSGIGDVQINRPPPQNLGLLARYVGFNLERPSCLLGALWFGSCRVRKDYEAAPKLKQLTRGFRSGALQLRSRLLGGLVEMRSITERWHRGTVVQDAKGKLV